MIHAIDHIVILSDDLAAASADYAALGFTVTPGGEHTGGATHNALVVFADDTYIELIAFKRAAPDHRWWPDTAAGEGLIDFALLPGAIEADIAAARQRGLQIEGPTDGGRLRPDGQQVAWRLGQPPTPDLPFLCGDVTPRGLRVPEGDARRHPNGVGGIAGLTVAVADLDASVARYQALLGQAPTEPPLSPPGFAAAGPGARFAAFALGTAAIVLAAPDEGSAAGAALRDHLARRGEGPYALALRTDSAASAGRLDPARTHGVPIELIAR
jgi:catechol 2,3-dioxygenase-like lactoylglutathione lyase family enzyme